MKYTNEWLTKHDYDGLYDAAAQGEDSCGCRVGDLYPCDSDYRYGRKCIPGVTVTNDDGTTGIGKKMKPKRAVILFQNRFVPLIESGAKQNTIRGRYIAPGTVLSLRRWTGKPYRSKQEIIKEVTCTGCHEIEIFPDMSSLINRFIISDTKMIATLDGFDTENDMIDWFKRVHGLPYAGCIIRWNSQTHLEFIESVRLK